MAMETLKEFAAAAFRVEVVVEVALASRAANFLSVDSLTNITSCTISNSVAFCH